LFVDAMHLLKFTIPGKNRMHVERMKSRTGFVCANLHFMDTVVFLKYVKVLASLCLQKENDEVASSARFAHVLLGRLQGKKTFGYAGGRRSGHPREPEGSPPGSLW
jgi:hypothetical protein